MTTAYATQSKPKASLLRTTLRTNGVLSVLSGIIMVIDAGVIASFLNVEATLPIVALGVFLGVHGGFILMNTRHASTSSRIGWYAIMGDLLWVAASSYVLLADPFGFSSGGKWLTLFLADFAALFAAIQFYGIRRLQR